ncbi:MAG: hypothetical protein HOP29_17340 [Phycisphaerales bacterium]|nr:hypothetical protein [Phycisphaerales bacterium]
MPQERNAFRLGLMTIVVVVLLFTAVMFIGGRRFDAVDPIVVRVRHDLKVPRIKPGAPIICGPQQVGLVNEVTTIEGESPDDPAVKDFLFFEFHGEVNQSLGLRSDCRIVVEGQILGDQGQLVVESRGLSPERISPEKPVSADASGFASDVAMITQEFDRTDPTSLISRVRTQLDAGSAGSIMAKVHGILDNLQFMTLHLQRVVDPSRREALTARLSDILEDVHQMTTVLRGQLEPGDEHMILAKLHRTLDALDKAMAAAVETVTENREDIRSTVGDVREMASTLNKSIIPALERELSPDSGDSLLTKVHNALDEVNAALDDVSVVAAKGKRVATLSADRLVATVDNAKEATGHLKAVAKDIRSAPWRLIHQPGEIESKQAYVFAAVREFSDASGSLDDSLTQLRVMLEANPGEIAGDHPSLIAVRDQLKAAFERFTDAEQALWTQLEVADKK